MRNFLHENRTKSRKRKIKMTKSGILNEKRTQAWQKTKLGVLCSVCVGSIGQAKVEKGSFT